MSKQIKLREIDPLAITTVRKLKDKNNAYKILKFSIEQDGQRNPIIIRLLTEDEKKAAHKDGAKYGIIDGHHRYDIAQKNNKDTILADIDVEPPSEYRDMKLALRFNNTNIRMTPLEKGEVIYKLLKANQQDPTIQNNIDEIGEELFGMKTSMTYLCLKKYRESIGERTIEKPRETININMDNPHVLDEITETMSFMALEHPNIATTDDCKSQLEKISSIEKNLRAYKKALLKLQTKFEAEENEDNY